MRIVVLDAHTLNPGDLSWEPLEQLGECAIYDRCAPNDVVARARGAEIVLTNKAVLSREQIEQLPGLKYIGVTATGYNMVDALAARRRGICLTNVPAYGTGSVAQMAMAHLLNLAQRVGDHAAGVRAGKWSACEDFCYWDVPLLELEGLTMGIVGFGRIGRATAALARAFGMKVIACETCARAGDGDVEFVGLDELFRRSDAVSLHCPLSPETHGMIDAARLAQMKPTAFLINTSRGPLVDERALAEALNAGRIAGAGLDVLEAEPPEADNPLFGAKNCFVTPHIAWATRGARQRLLEASVENVRAFLAGRPRNVVN